MREPTERRRSDRISSFYAGEVWLCLDGSWTGLAARVYDESEHGIRMRVRQDLRGKDVLLKLCSDSDTAARCRIVSSRRAARDCWEYGVETTEVVDFEEAVAVPCPEPVPQEPSRQDDRYAAGAVGEATLRYEDSDEVEVVQLVDFSARGAGLLVAGIPRIGASVIVAVEDGDQSIEFLGLIRWAEPDGHGQWRVGCRFNQTTLEFGLHESRSLIRSPCRLKVAVRAAHQDQPLDANVVNFSQGGLSLECRGDLTPGQRLMVRAADHRFYVTTQWCSRSEITRAGCQFLTPGDRSIFETLVGLDAEVSPCRPQSDSSGKSLRGLVSACLLIYGWCGLYLSGLWPL